MINFKLISPHWRVIFGLVAGATLAGFTGCMATGDFALIATISSGEKVRVPLGRGGPVPAKEDGVEVNHAGLSLNEEKKGVYGFFVSAPNTLTIKSVLVEDVSDEMAVTLVDDAAPVIKDGRWSGLSRPIASDEANLRWVFHVDNSLRVYRITVTSADGRKRILHQGSMYPDWRKMVMRQAFGLKY